MSPRSKVQSPRLPASVVSRQSSVGKTMDHPLATRDKPRYIMIGGFLGAGKTTSLVKLAARLIQQGRRVGLITNDQGSELVDTAMLRSKGFATEEIDRKSTRLNSSHV